VSIPGPLGRLDRAEVVAELVRGLEELRLEAEVPAAVRRLALLGLGGGRRQLELFGLAVESREDALGDGVLPPCRTCWRRGGQVRRS
jgi:hypothetical protein